MFKIKPVKLVLFTMFCSIAALPVQARQAVQEDLHGYNPIQYQDYVDMSIWSAGRDGVIKDMQTNRENTWSPPHWSALPAEERYAGPTRYIAHRGLVDLHNGIAENSVHAVYNAVKNKQFMVEIDVQATKDSIAVPTHDNNLHRVLNDSRAVNSVKFREIKGRKMLIKRPDSTHVPAEQGDCAAGNEIVSLAELVTNIVKTDNHVRKSTFSGCPLLEKGEITWVFDPKNRDAAKTIVGRFMSGANPKVTQHLDSIAMKVYPAFYWNDDGTPTNDPEQIANVAAKVMIDKSPDKRIKVIPVVSVGSFLAAGDVQSAVDLAVAVAKDWGKYFEVLSIEAPGAWNDNWIEFANELSVELSDLAHTAAGSKPVFGYNPLVSDSAGESGDRYPPRISIGYRFADYVKGGTYPDFQNGVAYDWGMDGMPQLDTGPKARRTIGGTNATTRGYCRNTNACWITTDYPMHEWAFRHGLNYKRPEPVHNAPMTNPSKP